MKDFKDKVAVITGAASGIGFGLAERCAQEGMKVVLADIESEALSRAAKDIEATGMPALAVETDVSKITDIEALAQKTLAAFGGVHLLFNNAGVAAGTTVWGTTVKDWEWTLGVNLWGVINGLRTFVPIMLREQTDCHVVNTSSIGGLTSGAGGGIYRATKHAIVSLSESLYFDLQQINSRIGVSVLCPSMVRSRVLESERNRPLGLRNPPQELIMTPETKLMYQAFFEQMEKAMPPARCADIVFGAIKDNTFYIFTDPKYKEDVRLRMESIILGTSPAAQIHLP